MKALFCFLLIFLMVSDLYSQEGKQENILKIEKFGDESKVYQSPMETEKLPSKEESIKTERKVIIEKPKAEPIMKKIETRISESLALKKAWKLYEEGKFNEASERFKTLLNSSHRDIALSARLGFAYSLKNLNLHDEAFENFEYLYSKDYKQEEVVKNMVEILLIKQKFSEAEKYAVKLNEEDKSRFLKIIGNEKLKKSFREIEGSRDKRVLLEFLEKIENYLNECLSPEVFFEIAKALKPFEEEEKARDVLEKLLSCKAALELRAGILYELSSLIGVDEMLITVEKEEKAHEEQDYLKKLTSLKLDLYRKKLASLEITSLEIEKIAEQILKIDPEDSSTKALLAWHYYNTRQYEKALSIFSQLNKKEPENEDYLVGIAYCYNALGKDDDLIHLVESSSIYSEKLALVKADAYIRRADKNLSERDYSKAFSTVNKLAKADDPISKQKAGEWYCKQGFPVLASHVDSLNDKACYFKEQFPHLEFEGSYRFKSGDKGFSRLKEFSMPLSFYYPLREGQKLSFRIIQRYVSSGSAGENPYMGTFYNYLNGQAQKNSPVYSKWLIQPEIGYEKEGYPHIDLSISTTPLNGTVSAMPLFNLNLDYRDFWINLHQSSVQESILSIQGQKDPYSNDKWGRVIKTGVQSGLNLNIPAPYWFSIYGEFNYLWGKNVWENYSLEGNLSFGRTFSIDETREFDMGIFYVIQHFRRNTNFFTFGHGGYFSPQIFHMVGPTFRYKIKECCGLSLDIKVSAGYIYYRTDSSPHYPKISGSDSYFNASALNDIRGNYEGESKSKIGGSIDVRFRKNINKNLSFFTYGKGNVSGGYNEWNAGLGLIYYFMP